MLRTQKDTCRVDCHCFLPFVHIKLKYVLGGTIIKLLDGSLYSSIYHSAVWNNAHQERHEHVYHKYSQSTNPSACGPVARVPINTSGAVITCSFHVKSILSRCYPSHFIPPPDPYGKSDAYHACHTAEYTNQCYSSRVEFSINAIARA